MAKPHATDTHDRIAPILTSTYGDNGMARALAHHLAGKIDAGDFDWRGREHGVMQICWMWFPGGGTAQNVARKIEEGIR